MGNKQPGMTLTEAPPRIPLGHQPFGTYTPDELRRYLQATPGDHRAQAEAARRYLAGER